MHFIFLAELTDFHNFPGPVAFFQDFPVLENAIIKFQDFPGFPGPVRTLYINLMTWYTYFFFFLADSSASFCFLLPPPLLLPPKTQMKCCDGYACTSTVTYLLTAML